MATMALTAFHLIRIRAFINQLLNTSGQRGGCPLSNGTPLDQRFHPQDHLLDQDSESLKDLVFQERTSSMEVMSIFLRVSIKSSLLFEN
jgi:hypothetical protein